jgi:hypothetical protein
MQRERDECFIHIEAAVLDRLRAMRGPSESYSDVILRIAAEASMKAPRRLRVRYERAGRRP